MHLAPGDVADTISQSMGGADEELLIEIRKDYGLDQPYFQQLATYIGKVLRFDLGHSFFFNEPVSKLVLERIPATLNKTAQTLIIARCRAWCLKARKPNGMMSHFVAKVTSASVLDMIPLGSLFGQNHPRKCNQSQISGYMQ